MRQDNRPQLPDTGDVGMAIVLSIIAIAISLLSLIVSITGGVK